MDSILTPRLKNYIIFSYIKDFVEDLSTVYDEESLNAYRHFINDANILTETSDFVEGFTKSLNGRHRAKYCEGVYINIPKFLSKNDENKDIILEYLKKISKLFSDIENECKELVFVREYAQNMSTDLISKSAKEIEASGENRDKYVKDLFESFKPDVQKTQLEFQKQNLNIDRFLKIILICAYDKLECVNIVEDDAKHIKNIINIVANTPLSKIASKKLDLIKEFMSIKNMQNFPLQNMLTSFNVSSLGF